MRYLTLLLLVFFLPLAASPRNETAGGNLSYGQEMFDNLKVNGFVTLNGTTIVERLQMNGRLNATNAQIGDLHANGYINLYRCTVKGQSTVKGSLSGFFSTFEQPITLTSANSVFDSCSISSIHVLQKNHATTQNIELKGDTHLTGSITFEAGNGQVIVPKESPIDESRIVGGKLIKR